MRRVEGGWWIHETPLEPGTDYAFSLDGSKPLPDPRSPWQPSGVHGPSRAFDHSAFLWTDQRWQPKPLASAIIYELHIGTFTPEGTFDSTIEKLDHLLDLGVTHVELMPVNEFSGNWGWGYDGVDLYAPHHAYGGPEALKRLVNACHERGLAVVLDVVYNHFGPTGNYLNQFGPYTLDKLSTPWGPAVNLDGPLSDEVRRFFCDNALMWLRDYHLDALRIDAVHALIDTSATHILEQLATEVEAFARASGRHVVLIAESDLNDPRLVRSRDVGGYGIDAQWSDDFHHAVHALLADENSGYYCDFGGFPPLAKALENVFVYDGCYSPYRQRIHGRTPTGLPPKKFVVFTQNHDQVGNRATGDRSSHLESRGRLKIAAALTLLSPYVPMLFQGEEWAASTPFQYFTDHGEAWLAQAVSEGRRSEFRSFGWSPDQVPDPQEPETLFRSKLNWDECAEPGHEEVLEWYRGLIELRRRIAFVAGDARPSVRYDERNGWMCVECGPNTLCFSVAEEPVEVPAGPGVILAQSEDGVYCEDGVVVLPPESVAVIGPEVR
jgi:maltooligosyltrehalose trehalohydrolase